MVNSIPNISGSYRSPIHSDCRIRYLELALAHVSKCKAENGFSIQATDLCILDLDHTLIAYVPANFTEKYHLAPRIWDINNKSGLICFHSLQGINILRDGVMELIDVLHEQSVEVVIYSMGSAPHVILSMIFMEMAYNHFWRSHELGHEPRTFRFSGLISTHGPHDHWKSFDILHRHGYDGRMYYRIMMVDDQHANVWRDNNTVDGESLRKDHGVKILKLSDGYVFGNIWTERTLNMSAGEILELFCRERKIDGFLFDVVHTWKCVDDITEKYCDRLDTTWMNAA